MNFLALVARLIGAEACARYVRAALSHVDPTTTTTTAGLFLGVVFPDNVLLYLGPSVDTPSVEISVVFWVQIGGSRDGGTLVAESWDLRAALGFLRSE